MAKKPRKRTRPFSVSEPSFKREGQFKEAVKKRARSQVQPLLQDVSTRRKEAVSAGDAREEDIGRYYGADLAARQSGSDRLNKALQGIMGSLGGAGTDVQSAMSAALRQQGDVQTQQASALGVAAPTLDPAYLASLSAGGVGNQMGLGGDMAGLAARAAADIGLSGTEQRFAGENETRRQSGVLDALTDERSDIMARLPGLREQARGAILGEETGKAQLGLAEDQFGETKRSNRFNEGITDRQTDLAEEQFGETKRAGAHARKMAEKGQRLNEKTLSLERKKLQADINNATNAGEKTVATERAAKFDKAAEWLTGHLAPNDSDQSPIDPDDPESKTKFDPKLWRSNRRFSEARIQLQRRFGMSEEEAMRVLMTAQIPEWRRRAQKILKFRGKRAPLAAGPGGTLVGSPGQVEHRPG
jgi:hypothetical protein